MDESCYPKRLEIYMAMLPKIPGAAQGGKRPVIVIQNDTGNKRADTTIVVPLTTREKKKLPTHVFLPSESTGLPRWSVALCEHVQTVSKKILYGRAGELSDENLIVELNHGIAAAVGLHL